MAAPLIAISASQQSDLFRDSFSYGLKDAKSFADVYTQDANVQEDDAFVATVMKSLKSATNERQLQDGVFNAMNALPAFKIPDECKKPPNPQDISFFDIVFGKIRKTLNPQVGSFSEKEMREILRLYSDRFLSSVVGEQARNRMNTTEPGLFIRASSRPDMAAAVVPDEGGGDILTGEVKNGDNYSVEDAVNQEAAYLMLLLYWWKTFASRDVKEVYGFTICGPKCRGLKGKRDWLGNSNAQYSVCVMKLSAPTTLGGIPFRTSFEWRGELKNDTGVKELCKFMKTNNLWSRHKNSEVIQEPFPALFIAPVGLPARAAADQQYSMVRNGTFSLVFRCTGKKGVNKIVNQMGAKEKGQRDDNWNNYLNHKDKKATMYVKINTSASFREFPGGQQLSFLREKAANNPAFKSFRQTYPVPPITRGHCYCVLMANRGVRVPETLRWNHKEFAESFSALWEETTGLSKAAELYHGDIAKHNLLHKTIKKKKKTTELVELVLIDWDEALGHPKSRVTKGNMELSLIHPEKLRHEPMLYTEVQLALLYWKLKLENVDGTPADLGSPDVASLIPFLEDYTNEVTESLMVSKTVGDLSGLKSSARKLVSATKKAIEEAQKGC